MKNRMKLMIVFTAILVMLTGCFGSDKPVANVSSGGITDNLSMPWIASKNTTRINSAKAAEAAAIVSQTLWMATSDTNRPGGVIIADPTDWQAALVSANLIHHPNDGPVLFADKGEVPEVTLRELKRLRPKGVDSNDSIQVILVGNLDAKVENQIKALGYKTDRVGGVNAPALAKEVDAYYADVTKELPQSVIVGSMDSADYTMPVVNWIAHMPEPLLYVKKDEIPKETAEALSMRDGQANIYIVGPESVVSSKVEELLGQYGRVVRISGDDPYENAIAFAKYKDPATGFGWGITAPGHNFSFVSKATPELALAAAPFSHLGKHAPLLWTDKKGMPDTVMSYVMSVQPKYRDSPVEGPYNHAWLTGSMDELSEAAQGEIDTMLEIVSESGAGHGVHGGGTADKEQPTSDEHDSKGEGGSSHH
ncbi:cell wall-binding repeat-containing protein [Paenibacillus paeoniae]|uniref:cell wall-binding repeat-containing protein n=1 Tax=Paenibacillus paeoniae TaxID=2292705 RepID=UPI00197D64DA|nr:cell wall-binding repeat-containing protein [Paenibacillus paeoniae]